MFKRHGHTYMYIPSLSFSSFVLYLSFLSSFFFILSCTLHPRRRSDHPKCFTDNHSMHLLQQIAYKTLLSPRYWFTYYMNHDIRRAFSSNLSPYINLRSFFLFHSSLFSVSLSVSSSFLLNYLALDHGYLTSILLSPVLNFILFSDSRLYIATFSSSIIMFIRFVRITFLRTKIHNTLLYLSFDLLV